MPTNEREKKYPENPSRFAVFENTVDVLSGQNKPIRELLNDWIIMDDVHTIVVGGQPGVGKSTFNMQAEQFIRLQPDVFGLEDPDSVNLRSLQFETDLKWAEEQFGPRNKWKTSTPWEKLSSRLYDRVTSPPYAGLTFVETVAVGEKDRGRSTMRRLSESDEVGVILFLPNPLVQAHAARVRHRIQHADKEEVLSVLHDERIYIENEVEFIERGYDLPALVKKWMESMARQKHILKIERECAKIRSQIPMHYEGDQEFIRTEYLEAPQVVNSGSFDDIMQQLAQVIRPDRSEKSFARYTKEFNKLAIDLELLSAMHRDRYCSPANPHYAVVWNQYVRTPIIISADSILDIVSSSERSEEV